MLGIFFGLVLICGVFFGFGYSMGRGTGSQANVPASSPASNGGEADEAATAAAKPPEAGLKQQEAPREQQEAPPPAVVKAPVIAPVKAAVNEDEPQEAAAAKPESLVTDKPSAGRQPPAYVSPADAPPSATGQPMVQIAAVARREDADVLVSALRQRGYGLVVRNEPQDKLLHVQVGPFADRAQAMAMKQKLLSDGYNAIIKQ